MKKSSLISTKKALIELYLSLKKSFNKDKNKKIDDELENLLSLDEITLIKYIKDSIDITISTLVEKKVNDYNNKLISENTQQDYESVLIKYEKDIRGHIRTEHQLKLYADSLQNNIEDLEKKNNKFTYYDKDYEGIIKKKNAEINELKNEINYNKKIIELFEEQKAKSSENEKKLRNSIIKLEKKYKNEIEFLNKKINYYENLFLEDKDNKEKGKKNNTIFCNSSRYPLCSNKNNDNSEYEVNQNINKIYRNMNNNFIGNNYSNSMSNSRPYQKIEKFISKKLSKFNNNITNNSNINQFQNKLKNLKSCTAEHSFEKKIKNINSYVPSNSYINDSRAQEEITNKLIINDSSLNINTNTNTNSNTNNILSKKSKKIYHRHKSIENANKFIKNKPLGIIKKILISNNTNNNNSMRNINKGLDRKIINNNSCINVKKTVKSNNASTINSTNNFINKSSFGINFNGSTPNINDNKNSTGYNFVNNINIYSNNIKQDNNSNIYIGANIKKSAGNYTEREIIHNNMNNHHFNNINNNYIHIHGNKNNFINYRNKPKDKINSVAFTNK